MAGSPGPAPNSHSVCLYCAGMSTSSCVIIYTGLTFHCSGCAVCTCTLVMHCGRMCCQSFGAYFMTLRPWMTHQCGVMTAGCAHSCRLISFLCIILYTPCHHWMAVLAHIYCQSVSQCMRLGPGYAFIFMFDGVCIRVCLFSCCTCSAYMTCMSLSETLNGEGAAMCSVWWHGCFLRGIGLDQGLAHSLVSSLPCQSAA